MAQSLKQQLIDALTANGVALKGDETVPALKALADENGVVVEAPKTTEPIVVKHRDHAGNPVERVFSKEVHGEDFAKHAAEFKATNASKLITE